MSTSVASRSTGFAEQDGRRARRGHPFPAAAHPPALGDGGVCHLARVDAGVVGDRPIEMLPQACVHHRLLLDFPSVW
jgi:hypothetical protein